MMFQFEKAEPWGMLGRQQGKDSKAAAKVRRGAGDKGSVGRGCQASREVRNSETG